MTPGITGARGLVREGGEREAVAAIPIAFPAAAPVAERVGKCLLWAMVIGACAAPAPPAAPAAPASVGAPRGCDKVDAVMAERARGGKPVEIEIVSQEAPRVLNARVVQRMMEDSASALSVDTAVYVTRLRYHVTALGGPEQFVVVRSSGAARFDSVAIWGMSQARFTPERVNGCPVAVWIEQDVTVQPRHKRRRAAPAPASGVQARPRP